MDALDAVILRQLGVEPFAGYSSRPRGLRATDVARSLGRSVRLVQDRMTRMEQDGVIAGYVLVPNPRHLGAELTAVYVPTDGAVDAGDLSGLADLDGFVMAVPYLGEGVCLTLNHATDAERDRRLNVLGRLIGSSEPVRTMYVHPAPEVTRDLSPLDWRIVAAMAADAKRPPTEVAEDVGVSVKTVRSRLARMRKEGSIDEVAALDFQKISGIMPFEIAVWAEDTANTLPALVERLRENYWAHFKGVPGGYCDALLRVFTATPAEAHQLVQAVARVPGVTDAKALMAAGFLHDPRWLQDAILARVAQ